MKTKIVKDVVILVVSAVWFTWVFSLFSCSRQVPAAVHTKETIKRDSLIFLPGDTVEKAVKIDSLFFLEENKWYAHSDSLHRAQLWYMRDRLNRLNMRAKCPPDTIKIEYVFTKEKTVQKIIEEKKVIPFWVWLVIFGLSSFSLLGLFLALRIAFLKK